MPEFYVVLTGSSLDKKIDFTDKNVLLPAGMFLSRDTQKLSYNPFIPECQKWFLDSGGFSLLHKWHAYPFSIEDYVNLINRKNPTYAAIMDYPCEPELSVTCKCLHHSRQDNTPVSQRILWTIENCEIMMNNFQLEGTTKLLPVIQGWYYNDYKKSIDLLHKKDLLTDYVAFGSMCRRMSIYQMKKFVIGLVDYLHLRSDCKVHMFGFSLKFLQEYSIHERVDSWDSAAWTHNQQHRRKKTIFARNQAELLHNYNWYMKRINQIVTMFDGQQKLEVFS